MKTDSTSDQGNSEATANQQAEFLRLYHFTSLEFGISNVLKQRIKIARILELNDPFEFRNVLFPRNIPNFQEKFENWRKELNDKCGIICFSKIFSNPLIWGHYAEKSTGLVLAFDVPKDDPSKVRYRSRFLKAPQVPISPKFARSLIASKAPSWKYEKEYRVFQSLISSNSELQANSGKLLFFGNFSNSMKLKEIMLGPDCAADMATVMALKRNVGPHVSIFRTQRSLKKFEIMKSEKL